MKVLRVVLLSVLVLLAHSVPAPHFPVLLAAKGYGASLVKVPVVHQFSDCGNPRNFPTSAPRTTTFEPETTTLPSGTTEFSSESTTLPPTTTTTLPPDTTTFPSGTTAFSPSTTTLPPTTTDAPSTGDALPSASGPPADVGSCISCAIDNFKMVNAHRAANGRESLGWSDALAGMAVDWSKEEFDRGIYEHSGLPYGENIMTGGAYSGVTWANVAQNYFDAWKNSEGHNDNMLLTTYKCMGVGFYGDVDSIMGTQIFSFDCP